ncbi:fungal-specific transcription factor domain-containing protein [Mycena crocata]|nr:fungal-specific transcription factor domain-containing protein [Mycena crocata]
MSSDEDQRDSVAAPAKKRRVQRACDNCRIKRRACDGLRMSAKKCTNCVENGLDCTFAGTVATRRSYVDALESRLELTEQLLRKLSPAQQAALPSSTAANSNTPPNQPSPGSSQWSTDSPILQHLSASSSTPPSGAAATTQKNADTTHPPGPGVELAALSIRSMNTPAPAPQDGDDDTAHIALTRDMQALSIDQLRERFNGASSSATLVKATVLLREGYEEKDIPWSSRRMRYWTFNPAAHRTPLSNTSAHTYVFPPPDLLSSLISLYFKHMNLYYPLLHRPTFERAIAGGLHTRDVAFGAVVLLVCAIASRWSEDARVLRRDGDPRASMSGGTGNGDVEGEGEVDPLTVGWTYFSQLPMTLDHLFVKPTVYNLQFYCLAASFLLSSVPTACWTFIGIGIRLAQDVGAHRASPAGSRPTVESELWKRAVWILVWMDRQLSSSLGRPCTTQYEDFDVELPIECEDEFWEGEPGSLPSAGGAGAFVQPPGRPSKITYFNCLVRLSNILAFSLKMLYSLNKSKSLLAFRDAAWEERIVAELDSALNGWVDAIPSHLRWDPNRRDDDFFDQSAFLYCQYYQVQITIHRPFIPMIRKGPSTPLPSLAICTNAARSSSHIVDIVNHRKNGAPMPALYNSAFISGIVLLLNVWSGKRTGLPPQMNTAMAEVHKCMTCIRNCEHRWQSAGLQWDLLYELATLGQMPLPNKPAPAPPSSATVGPGGAGSSNKRPRQDDTAQYASTSAVVAHYPPDANTNSTPLSFSNQLLQAAVPTYTADLGRMPVYDQYGISASSSSWYPEQSSAPLGYPDFTAGGATGPGMQAPTADALNAFAPAYDNGGLDFGLDDANPAVGGAGMSSDALAMWASAPMGFGMNDWGTYFNVMSELNQGLAAGSGAEP